MRPATTLAAIAAGRLPRRLVSGVAPGRRTLDAPAEGRDGSTKARSSITFLYQNAAGSAAAPRRELAVQQWKALGADVTAKGEDETALQGAIFGTGDWDVAWVPLNVNSPDQLVPFLSGPACADGGTNFSGIDNADYDRRRRRRDAP